MEQVLLWREDEIEILKSCLRSNGKNWSVMSEALNKSKSPDQCKKFFYSARKKHQLDKIVLEYKRVCFLFYLCSIKRTERDITSVLNFGSKINLCNYYSNL